MLTRLRLAGFKSWAETSDVRLAPVTGIFGSNSSGKTSLIQALLLLKQTADSADRGLALHFGERGALVNLGDFETVVTGHSDKISIRMGLDWRLDEDLVVNDSAHADAEVVKSRDLGFQTEVEGRSGTAGRSQAMVVREMAYAVGDAVFGMRQSASKGKEYEVFSSGVDFEFVRPVGRPTKVPPPAKCYGFPDQVRAYYQNAGFLSDLELALEERLRHVYYLGPLRAYPERRYDWAGAQPTDMGRAGEQAISAILASRERGETISPGPRKRRVTLEAYVARWLRGLGLIHNFRVEPLAPDSQVFQVKVTKSPGGSETLITDVGFGVSQVLPVLVLCFYVPEGSTVILEQPEIHLHPSVQARLADVLVDAWQRRRVQIIVESHSEHLLRRLQRRVAEERVGPEDVGLFFCEADRGRSSLTELQIDEMGNIANWPEDFFGDQFGELAQMQNAQLSRATAG